METECIVRKWGNSLGIVLPKELIDMEHLHVNDKVVVSIFKEANFRKIFGSLKRKLSGQEFKDMVRKGWK